MRGTRAKLIRHAAMHSMQKSKRRFTHGQFVTLYRRMKKAWKRRSLLQ